MYLRSVGDDAKPGDLEIKVGTTMLGFWGIVGLGFVVYVLIDDHKSRKRRR